MDNKKPLVSIIMNCYNCEQYLKEAIDSVYSQTFSDWEIIFWDNASTDSSSEIAKSYDQRLKYNSVSETTSLGKARNLAMKKAVGKYIAFLDCDDLYLPHKLEKQLLLMEASGSQLCYGSAIIINKIGQELRKELVQHESGFVFDDLLERYEINMQSVMVRSNSLKTHNIEFNESLKYCPDYNLFMKVSAIGDVDVIKDCLVKYRKLDNSLTSRSYHLIHKEMKFTLDQLFTDKVLFEEHSKSSKIAYKMLSYYEAIPYISIGDYKRARSCIIKMADLGVKYVLLYLLLLIPIPPNVIMKKIVG